MADPLVTATVRIEQLERSVGLLEEALRAIRDTPRSVLWKVYDIAAAALAGVKTGPPA